LVGEAARTKIDPAWNKSILAKEKKEEIAVCTV